MRGGLEKCGYLHGSLWLGAWWLGVCVRVRVSAVSIVVTLP